MDKDKQYFYDNFFSLRYHGEGAGFLVLERMDKALINGARIYAELLGYAITADANHPTAPDLSGHSHKRLMEKAIQRSGITKKEIDYINVHGTGTKSNDKAEMAGLNLTFGEHTKNIKISSIKGAVGHILGGAGVVEAGITALSIYHQKLIPNIGFKGLREGCELNVVTQSEDSDINIALTNNYAFGGNNASLVFGKFQSKRKMPLTHESSKVVITGIGFISPLGNSQEELLLGINNNTKSFYYCDNIPYFAITDAQLENITDYDVRRADRLGRTILAATQLALEDANLSKDISDLYEMGIISGTSYGHIHSNLAFNEMIVKGTPQFSNPIDFANSVTNAGCGLASINLKAKGCNIALCSGLMSGIQSLTLGYDLIKSGQEKIVICGGVECLDKFILDSLASIFKTPRVGKNNSLNYILNGETEKAIFGEGGCYFVLESESSALERNALVYSEIEGYGTFGDISESKLCGNAEKALSVAMKEALIKSSCEAKDIDIIIRSDLLMRHQQLAEINAIKNLFSHPVNPITFTPFFGVSAVLGPLGLASILSMQFQNKKIENNKRVLVNSMSFGGNACSMVIKPYLNMKD